MRYAKLYGNIIGNEAIVDTIFIPEQINHSNSCYDNPSRKKYYKSLDYITDKLGIIHIGNITYFTGDEWKGGEYTLSLINRAKRDKHFISLSARIIDGDISVEAFQASVDCIQLYDKNIIYFKHASNRFTITKPHRIVIGKNTIEGEIDTEFYITDSNLNKNGKYYVPTI